MDVGQEVPAIEDIRLLTRVINVCDQIEQLMDDDLAIERRHGLYRRDDLVCSDVKTKWQWCGNVCRACGENLTSQVGKAKRHGQPVGKTGIVEIQLCQ